MSILVQMRPLRSRLRHVQIHVRRAAGTGDGDALGVEAQLDPLPEVALQEPVILGLTHGRTAMFTLLSSSFCTKSSPRWVGENPRIGGQDIAQHRFDFAQVIGIAHAEYEVYAQAAQPRVIDQVIALNFGIRDRNLPVVARDKHRAEKLDLLDHPHHAIPVDQFAQAKRLEQHEDDRRRQIADRLLQRDPQNDDDDQRSAEQGLDRETDDGQRDDQRDQENAIMGSEQQQAARH